MSGGRRIAGYAFGLGAGATWGTTGPLSTALYAEGAAITGIGFWRVLLGLVGFLVYGGARREVFRIDRAGLLVVGLLGGFFVALFEVAYQYAIAGVGVAGAAALLYTAPVMVALAARPVLGEALTPLRVALAAAVMVGAGLTVQGGAHPETTAVALPGVIAGVAGGLLSAVAFAGTTLMARYAVPRYGSVRVLFWEIVGGVVILGVVLPLVGRTPAPPTTGSGWLYVLGLAAGSVLIANFFYFAAVRRIEAAPTAVAATIEPVVGALLALLIFDQRLTVIGWLGLLMVVGGVAIGYWREGVAESAARAAAAAGMAD